MESRRRFPKPVFFAGWTSIAFIALWEIRMHADDASTAITAGVLLLSSLAVCRYGLGLCFSTAPMLYLALLGLFHLGLVVPWALGIYDTGRTPWFIPYGLSPALALIIYSILAYQFGVHIALRGGRHRENSSDGGDSSLDNPGVFAAGGLLFLVGAIMFVIGVVGLDPAGYYRLTYSETFRLRAESDPRLFGSGITIASIGLYMAVAAASKQRLRMTILGAGLWLLTLFYWGFRGPALIAGLIVYAVALKKGISFPRWFPWLAGALLLIAIPIMRFAREEPLDQRFFRLSLHEFNILDAPAEMGASIRPLVETEALIGPANYRLGKTYLAELKNIVPNLALRWQAPSTESIDDLPPNHWITAVVDPWTYKNYGGMGFSAVAEPYMNFGLVGVVAYFFLLAFLLVRLEQISVRSAYGLASWALILSPLLWTTRNDFSNFFRPAVWGLLCLGVVRVFSGSYTLVAHAGRDNFRPKTKVPEAKRV